MGHKTDGRRYKPKVISAARAKSLVTRVLAHLEAGKKAYAAADVALDELIAGDLVGKEIELGDGRAATIVDQFADRNKCFKSNAFSRFKLEVK